MTIYFLVYASSLKAENISISSLGGFDGEQNIAVNPTNPKNIIAGYDFSDNAVNLRIIDLMKNKNKRIEIITPNVETTIKNARGAIYSILKD